MGKGETARYEQFLLFPQCFQKACFPGASKGVIVWEWVKTVLKSVTEYWIHMKTAYRVKDLNNTSLLSCSCGVSQIVTCTFKKALDEGICVLCIVGATPLTKNFCIFSLHFPSNVYHYLKLDAFMSEYRPRHSVFANPIERLLKTL